MNKKEKLIDRFMSNPISLRYIEIEKVLFELGFEKMDARGSHVKFKHSKLENDLIFPIHNNDCKDYYKKQTLKILISYHLI